MPVGSRPRCGQAALAQLTAPSSIAFEHVLWPLVQRANVLLDTTVDQHALENLTESARNCLILMLLRDLSGLCAPALYERFSQARKTSSLIKAEGGNGAGASCYEQFVVDMKSDGFRRLFEGKPVLLRLIAVVVRQWIDSTRDFVLRLNADLPIITRTILQSADAGQAVIIEGDRSDRHNGGRSVFIVGFKDGSRVVYKPKDLRVDAAWHTLVSRLSGTPGSPVELKSARTLACDGYGWTEFVDHTGCADQSSFGRFFRRAGAWLALFHCFAATDMHQENIIACGEHPVPIDLEMILQASVMEAVQDPEEQAAVAAMEVLSGSVMSIGLLPAYGRAPNNSVFAMGGMTSEWGAKSMLSWSDINSDAMRPVIIREAG